MHLVKLKLAFHTSVYRRASRIGENNLDRCSLFVPIAPVDSKGAVMRRKGEKPRPIILNREGNLPVTHAIATGSYWFEAWVMQQNTPWPRLSKTTGIPQNRLLAISSGDDVSRAEVDALARAWSVSSNDLIRSIDGAVSVVE
jgi:hypothetical protein